MPIRGQCLAHSDHKKMIISKLSAKAQPSMVWFRYSFFKSLKKPKNYSVKGGL